ncbi:hypothetical protein B0A55_00052 [Friedmanniomyces simplex]|uniref:Uncharacterized protein n=1 Tax=Friedmanniomyces simplex TaxID=329884 RepID=A0A4U0Y2U8_9PEZI|nr:hypothetical protein B0A55_00052 [Friedmanniomyces simplex]
MANQKYQRLSMFREATMRDNTFSDPSQSRAAPTTSHAAFNYKPTILRTLSLLSFFVFTIALIGLLQYAVIELPHGTSTRRDRIPGLSATRRDVPLLHARQASNSSGNAVASSSFASAASPSDANIAITMTTIQSAYLATDTTQTLSTTIQSPAQTVQTIAYSTAAASDYVPTDATQTITPSISYTTVPSASFINVPITASGSSQVTSWTQVVSLTTVPSHTVITVSGSAVTSWTQVVSATTVPSNTLINVAVSGAGSTQVTSWTQVVSAVTPGAPGASQQVSLTTVPSHTTINVPDTPGTGSTQVTSWTQVVSAVTLGASSQQLHFTTVPSHTVINIPNSSGTGSVQVTSWTQVVETVPLSGTVVATGGSTQVTSSPADNAASLGDIGGKDTLIAHRWSAMQTFFGTYLAVLIAVIYRMIWTVINNNFNLVEPFRQLNESNGAVAERALFSFYQTHSNLLGPLPALLKRRWALALVGTTYLVACLMPALGSEAIYVDTDWGCPHPMEGMNSCQAQMTADATVLRIMQGLLAFAALTLLILISLLLLTKTGLPANPSSMATIASLMRNPALLDDLNEIPPDADATHMRQALTGRRYKLDAYKTAAGEYGYGIVPVYGNGQDEQSHTPGYAPLAGAATSSRSHRFRIMDFVLPLVVTGSFGVVLAYYLDGKHDGFNNFFSSNTFGPRFILTFAATVVASLWKTVEQSAVIVAPYTRLAHHPSSAKSTILFTPHNTPFLATITAIWNRYFLAAVLTFVTLTAEALNIVISGVPYATGQTITQFLVSIYMSLAILGVMVVVSVVVILSRRREPRMPRKPETVGAVMSYLATSRMLQDFDGVDWQDGAERDRRIRLVGKRYTFEQRRREDGKFAWGVDEAYE